jgi:hypothetical protein
MIRLCLILLFAGQLSAAQWYVRTDGSDSNSGSADTSAGAKLTLDSALSIGSLAPGDTINVGPGTFTGTADTDVAGTAGNPITILGSGTNLTTFTAKLTVDQSHYTIRNATFTRGGITVSGTTSNVIIDGVDIFESVNAIIFANTTSNCRAINSRLRFAGANSLFNVGGSGHLIATNYIYDGISSSGNEQTTSATSVLIGTGTKVFTVGAGLTTYFTSQYVEAESAANTANYMRGWVVSYSGTTLTLDVTTTGGSGTFSDWLIRPFAGANHADIWQYFSTGTDWFTRDIVWEQNIIKNGSSQICNGESHLIPDNFKNHIFRNNLIFNNRLYWNSSASNFFVLNNTIYNAQSATGFINPAPRSTEFQGTMYVTNNAFVRIGGTESSGPYSGADGADYNLITDLDDSAKTGYPKVSGQEASGINGGYTPSQIFADADSENFAPINSGPLPGAGVNLHAFGVTDDLYGTARPSSGPMTLGAITAGAGLMVPNAPSGLAASAASTSLINLTWTDNATDETSQQIERRVGLGGTWTPAGTIAANLESNSHDSLAQGTLYYFRVRACNDDGCSAWSNEASATTDSPLANRTSGPAQSVGTPMFPGVLFP